MKTIAFIGPGIMGAPMITNLRSAGYTVRGFGRSSSSRERAERAGAEVMDSVREACDGADAAITMLPDGPDVLDVALGEDGLIAALPVGAIWIDHSTISPETARQGHKAAREKQIHALDAPVSGGEAGAVEGSLSIMVGGERTAFDHALPIMEAMGRTIVHVGEAGSGQVVKAANQMIVAGNIQMLSEATVFLQAHGADLDAAFDVLGGGLAGSTVLQRKRENMLRGEFAPGFRIALHDKDLGIVAQATRATGLSLPATALVSALVSALRNQGAGDLDHSALLKLATELNRNVLQHAPQPE